MAQEKAQTREIASVRVTEMKEATSNMNSAPNAECAWHQQNAVNACPVISTDPVRHINPQLNSGSFSYIFQYTGFAKEWATEVTL